MSVDDEVRPADLTRAITLLASGAALAVHITLGLPLLAVWAAALLAGAVVTSLVSERGERLLGDRRVLLWGLVPAVLATAAYDVSRLLLVEVGGWPIHPFDAFPHFGTALIGEGASASLRTAVGAGFHLVNGLAFALAYVVLLGRRGVLAGIAWGLGLELAMIALYPRWLQIAELRLFLTMSVLGHVAYGATLGWTARRALQRLDARP